MKRLALDIETVPIETESVEPDASKKASLDALTGRVICIGCLVLDAFQIRSSSAMVSDNEATLLKWFWDLLAEERVNSFVAHNGLGFDLPFLWKRSVILGIRPSVPLDLRRYKTDFVYDTMCVWANWEIKGNVSLDALSRALKVGSKQGEGAQVLDLWREERFQELAEYCLHDCWLAYACYCHLNFAVPSAKAIQEDSIKIAVSR
jgi:DNA polymerase elongation subunit (family B)